MLVIYQESLHNARSTKYKILHEVCKRSVTKNEIKKRPSYILRINFIRLVITRYKHLEANSFFMAHIIRHLLSAHLSFES